jgi:phosphoribosylformylglycinamidine synthase
LFWQLQESVRGLGDACRALNTPITGGNCSLYNQSPAGPIDPTPTVAMVGQIERAEHVTTQWFKAEGDAILLLGEAVDPADPLGGLGGSAYLQVAHRLKTGLPPRCDLERARALHDVVRALIHSGEVKSAHDCSDGGLAVALAECCLTHQIARETPRPIGASVDLSSSGPARLDALLFGEAQNRVVISAAPLNAAKVAARARLLGVTATVLGTVGGSRLRVKTASGEWSWDLAALYDAWWNAIARQMESVS